MHLASDAAAIPAALAARLHALVTCKGTACRNAPRVAVRARGCGKVSVSGSDILSVAFQVNGKSVLVDRRRPFRVSLARKRFRRGANLVRARISLRYDRLVTRDALVRCR